MTRPSAALQVVTAALGAAGLIETIHGSNDVEITGVTQDSRTVQPGNLFLAWSGSALGRPWLRGSSGRDGCGCGRGGAVRSRGRDSASTGVGRPLGRRLGRGRGPRLPVGRLVHGRRDRHERQNDHGISHPASPWLPGCFGGGGHAWARPTRRLGEGRDRRGSRRRAPLRSPLGWLIWRLRALVR